MILYENISDVPDAFKNGVLVIGNFDGVHLGHRAVIGKAKSLAVAKQTPLVVLTFEPHPRNLFRPDDPPFRITPPVLKQRLLKECGVDAVVSLHFDWNFASQSAEDFIEHILKTGLAPTHVLVGEDFRFGQLRKGSAQMMADHGLSVEPITPVANHDGIIYSSTTIRQFLRQGDIDSANALLGWDWEIGGTIVRGDRRGHELGYPTANVMLRDVLHPAYGIYATWVQIEGEDIWRMAATNIGIRPMFEVKQGQVEAHILDFEDRDIYGKFLKVRPVRRLRGEAKFSGLDALIAQIDDDCIQTREILKKPA